MDLEAAAPRWVPQAAQGTDPIRPEGTDLDVWLYDVQGMPYAIGYMGKSGKPLFHTRYRNEAQRAADIERYAEARRTSLRYKEQKKQERREYAHDYKVGDILVSSWGYDQTNIDYYQVTRVIGPQMIEMREIGKEFKGTHGQSDIVVPAEGRFEGPAMRKKVSPGGYVRLTSYSSASRWDGKPDHQTNSMYGH